MADHDTHDHTGIPGVGGYPLDSYAIDGTYGDHFDEASLNARWTRRGFTGESMQLGKDATWMRIDPNGRTRGDGYYQTAPTGDWTFAVKFIPRIVPLPIGFSIRVVNSSGTGVETNRYSGAAAGRLYLLDVVTYSTYGGAPAQEAADTGYPPTYQPIWLSLRKSGTNYYGAESGDGETWGPEIGPLAWSGTVDRVAFGIATLGTIGATPMVYDIDWFNKIA